MFILFKLSDVKTRYTTIEREVLAVVYNLTEVRWLVIGSPYLTKIYTNYTALILTLENRPDSYSKIAR
jgi:hypothetical protein